MAEDFKFKKRAIIAGVALLIAADVALAGYSWHLASSPSTTQQQLNQENLRIKLFKKQVEVAEQSAANFPKTLKDCVKFDSALPTAGSASSAISAELGDVSRKSGVLLADIKYHDKEIEGRNITQREMDADISGPYISVVKFLNSLQKSSSYYVVDSLDLGTEASAPNIIHVRVHMKTFFRTAAA